MWDVDAEDADAGVGAFTGRGGAQERQLGEGRDVAEVMSLPKARGAAVTAFAAAAHAARYGGARRGREGAS